MPLDDTEVRAARDDYVYDPHRNFDTPVIIRGTNRVLKRAQTLTELEPTAEALQQLVAQCSAIDRQLSITRYTNLARLTIAGQTQDALVLRTVDEPAVYYVLHAVHAGGELPLSRFSSLLGIPFSFVSKNPTGLNSINFAHYLETLKQDSNRQTPVDLVYESTPVAVTIPQISTPVQAFPVVNFLKAPVPRAGEVEADPTVSRRLPLFSTLLQQIKNCFAETELGFTPVLQSYALGYGGENKGRHFARILFDKAGFNLNIKGEPVKLGVTIQTDFAGGSPDFGTVTYGFTILRLICSNGMTVGVSPQAREQLIQMFVRNELSRLPYAEGSEEHTAAQSEAQARAALLFNPNGIKVTVATANAGFDTALLRTMLEFVLQSEDLFRSQLEALDEQFTDVSRDDFVEAVLALSSGLKIKSPELINYFVLEYVAGELSGQQYFRSPWDVLQFLTFIARSYDTQAQLDMEMKAFTFVTALRSKLTERRSDLSTFDQYAARLNPRLLGLDQEL